MDFIEIDIFCHQDLKDILTAELCELGYESFLDTTSGFRAYQPVKNHDPDLVTSLLGRYELNSSFKTRKLCDKNWNEVWEKTYEPIEINDGCRIRASFHEAKSDFPFEIIIDPKMSFGTGHHETTRQVVRNLLAVDFTGKTVLDVGCGTGVLGILVEMMGAVRVVGLDTDPYAVSNTVENMVLNNCKKLKVREGTVKALENTDLFDVVIANVNRNVLLQEIGIYARHMNPGGLLFLSGFYTADSPGIVKTCEASGLQIARETLENGWACLVLGKNQA